PRSRQRLECPLHALPHRPEWGHRENHDVVTHLLKLRGGQVGRLPELGHVREEGGSDLLPELAELVPALESLGEDDLGTRLEVRFRPLDRRITTLHRPRIRPRAYYRSRCCCLA